MVDLLYRINEVAIFAITEREIMEELRHEIRETLQTISDGFNNL